MEISSSLPLPRRTHEIPFASTKAVSGAVRTPIPCPAVGSHMYHAPGGSVPTQTRLGKAGRLSSPLKEGPAPLIPTQVTITS